MVLRCLIKLTFLSKWTYHCVCVCVTYKVTMPIPQQRACERSSGDCTWEKEGKMIYYCPENSERQCPCWWLPLGNTPQNCCNLTFFGHIPLSIGPSHPSSLKPENSFLIKFRCFLMLPSALVVLGHQRPLTSDFTAAAATLFPFTGHMTAGWVYGWKHTSLCCGTTAVEVHVHTPTISINTTTLNKFSTLSHHYHWQ